MYIARMLQETNSTECFIFYAWWNIAFLCRKPLGFANSEASSALICISPFISVREQWWNEVLKALHGKCNQAAADAEPLLSTLWAVLPIFQSALKPPISLPLNVFPALSIVSSYSEVRNSKDQNYSDLNCCLPKRLGRSTVQYSDWKF